MTANTGNGLMRWGFAAAAVVALFTGFGNMPLYGRYYIADIPGLQWSGDFIANLKVHFVAGAALLAIAAYRLVGIIMTRKAADGVTFMEKLVGGALAFVVATGVVVTVKNFPGVTPGLKTMLGINFLHLGAAMAFAVVGVLGLVVRPK
jgi:hypothetical protein